MDRTLAVLGLFTLEQPTWTVEAAAAALDVSASSAYRYFAALEQAGFLTSQERGQYLLGPAFLQYDRQIQLTDPLLRAASPLMSELAGYAPDGTTVVLCRAFRDSVICVHQVLGRGPQPLVSYERGRPMPLFKGATSTAILAWLNNRQLKRIYQEHAKKIAAAKLGTDWQSFRASMAAIRKAGFVVAWHQVDSGRAGIAAPILDSGGKVLGSLSYIVLEAAVDEARVMRLASLIVGAARETEKLLLQAASPVKQRKKTRTAAR